MRDRSDCVVCLIVPPDTRHTDKSRECNPNLVPKTGEPVVFFVPREVVLFC